MTETTDFESANRSEMHDLMRSGGDSPAAAEPVAETPVVDAPEGGTPTDIAAPEPEPAPETVAASPDQAPEGSTPQGQPAPAETVTSAFEKLVARYGGDREKAASEMLAMESRFAAMVKEQKASPKEAPVAAPSAAATPVAAPLPIAPPVLEQPAPVAGSLEDVVNERVAEDVECRALAEKFNAATVELQQIAILDPNGRPVGGRLAELDKEITDLQRSLQAPEILKKRGIDVPEMDALARQDIERAIRDLKIEKIEAINQYNFTTRQINDLSQRFEGRRNQYRNHYAQQEQQARAEADRTAEVDSLASVFATHWKASVASVIKTNSVPAELQADIEEALYIAAQARPNVITAEEMPAFMDAITKREMAKNDRYHRLKSAEYAKVKEADVKRVAPGPSGKGAVATPAKTETTDFEQRNRAELRAALRSQSA